MFTAALVTITKTQKQLKHPSLGEWIKKMSHTHKHTHTYNSAVRKKEILTFVTTWMKVEHTMLR